MIRLNMHEAKTHLSRYVAELKEGETIILCRRNKPVAEIRPLPPERKARRPIGLCRGQFTIPESFFDPLPDDFIDAFENGPIFPDE